MSTDLMVQGENEVSGLVRLAIEQGVSVEVLERLVALQERVAVRNARAAFFEAVSSFQDQCPEIRKVKTAKITTNAGAGYNYTYAPLEEITRTIRPTLRANGLSYSWDTADGGKNLNVVCVLRHIEGHEERSTFPVPVETKAAMSDAQKNGAALTYGRRQSLVAVLGLTTADEDKDGASRHGSAEVITEKQAADLGVLLAEVGTGKSRFLEWVGAESMEQITVDKYARAVAELEARRK